MTSKHERQKKEEKQPQSVLVSQRALDILSEKLQELHSRKAQHGLAIGEAGGTSDWHDNAALDQAHINFDLSSAQVAMLETRLKNVQVITPRAKISVVGIGNEVTIQFEGEKDTETYQVLGPLDVMAKIPGVISYESPLGAALLGRKKSEKVDFEISGPQQSKSRVTIIRIGCGSF